LTYSLQREFSTPDKDHDLWLKGSCAGWYKAGWWYNRCSESSLNGHHFKGGPFKDPIAGVEWKQFKGFDYSLKTTEMKLRPAHM